MSEIIEVSCKHCSSPISVVVTEKTRLKQGRRCLACKKAYKLSWKRARAPGPRAVVTACPKGHPFPQFRRPGRYDCAACHRDRALEKARARGVAARGPLVDGRPPRLKEVCANGHEMILANRKGGRPNGSCLACHRLRENGIRSPEARRYAKVLLNDPCSYCEDGWAEEIDHIVPVSRNGSKSWDNLTAACTSCNRQKYERAALVFMCERII